MMPDTLLVTVCGVNRTHPQPVRASLAGAFASGPTGSTPSWCSGLGVSEPALGESRGQESLVVGRQSVPRRSGQRFRLSPISPVPRREPRTVQAFLE